jgi:hypothetical protein
MAAAGTPDGSLPGEGDVGVVVAGWPDARMFSFAGTAVRAGTSNAVVV